MATAGSDPLLAVTRLNTGFQSPLFMSTGPDVKDTAPSRMEHTPPLCGSPLDTTAFPAAPQTVSVPRSDFHCYPNGPQQKKQTNI